MNARCERERERETEWNDRARERERVKERQTDTKRNVASNARFRADPRGTERGTGFTFHSKDIPVFSPTADFYRSFFAISLCYPLVCVFRNNVEGD